MSSSIYRLWGEKAAENAVSLAEEARLLYCANRIPRAYYLAHMSTEESAKSLLLKTMSVAGASESELNKVARLLRDHKKKIEFLVTYAAESSELLHEKISGVAKDLIAHINELKNNTMYVSCDGSTVSTPEDKVGSTNVSQYVDLAELLSEYARRFQASPSVVDLSAVPQ